MQLKTLLLCELCVEYVLVVLRLYVRVVQFNCTVYCLLIRIIGQKLEVILIKPSLCLGSSCKVKSQALYGSHSI